MHVPAQRVILGFLNDSSCIFLDVREMHWVFKIKCLIEADEVLQLLGDFGAATLLQPLQNSLNLGDDVIYRALIILF